MNEHLLRELIPAVTGVLVRRGADFATAEDAVQEGLIRGLSAWGDELPAEDRTRFAQQIQEQSLRLRDLVDRMLELSRLEGQRAIAHPRPVVLLELIDEVATSHVPLAIQRGVGLVWEARADITLTGEPEALVLLFSNLWANALDFAPEGTATPMGVRARSASLPAAILCAAISSARPSRERITTSTGTPLASCAPMVCGPVPCDDPDLVVTLVPVARSKPTAISSPRVSTTASRCGERSKPCRSPCDSSAERPRSRCRSSLKRRVPTVRSRVRSGTPSSIMMMFVTS